MRNRFEYIDDRVKAWSKYIKSPSPVFSKITGRKEMVKTPSRTYDANVEYCKNSLAKGVPDFNRYIERPPPGKKLITPDY
jgi:hypothetical protein